MRRPLLLAALGVAAFLLFLLAMLPASVLLRFAPPGLAATGLAGSVWKGVAANVAWQGHPIGRVGWNCRVLALLHGRLSYDLLLERPDGRVSLNATTGPDRTVDVTGLAAALPVAAFEGLAPPGWSGQVEASIPHLRIEGGWPVAIDGRAVVRSLRAPGATGLDIGSYELTLGEGQVGTDALTGRLRDLGGPLRVRGHVSLTRDRRYLLQGDVSPGPGADDRVFRTLSFLGSPDSAGRRPFAIEGSL